MPNAKLEAIHCYPVKGFPGHSLNSAKLEVGIGLNHDRRYAITNGTKSDTGEWMSSRSFFINSTHDGLLRFETSLDAQGDTLTLTSPSGTKLNLDMGDENSLKKANAELATLIKELDSNPELTAPQIIERPAEIGNWDFPDTPISLINMASIEEIGESFDQELEQSRFRCNLMIRNLPAWEEFNYLGKRLQIGTAEIDVMRPIRRCPAPGVNPQTGDRDIKFAEEMPKHFGHAYCGMYAKVVKEGKINTSSTITIIGDAELPLSEALASDDTYPLWPRILEISTAEISEETTRLSLGDTSPWPLPEAKPGQRLRFHLGINEWTTEYITATSPDHYHLEIAKSETDDPVTEKLRTSYSAGDRLVVSGPFGRV